ncbi:MAG: UDP-N-acetylmuramoyl-L-alanine--D-glutamate ligase [Oscillospiraceae bacterium]|nr:UDP-N-acetylmuramoyl-L-alanine--D-glutamate ligase [Oscillospiraceae bacterium]
MNFSYNYKFDQFIENIKNKTVTFLGLGVSHRDTIKLLAKKNIKVSVRDKKDIESIDPDLVLELKNLGVKLIFGKSYLDNIDEDIVFRTPGMNFNHPVLEQLHQNGTIITSEMEVFFDLCPCKIIGVTGSDGKTTTSTIISEFLKASGFKTHLGGNIGRALLPIIETITPLDFAVVELSSFQLISMRKSPNIAVITNIEPNHLDVHKDFNEYISAKKNIFLHQSSLDKLVLNFDNITSRHFLEETRSKISLFSYKNDIISGAFLDNKNNIYIVDKNSKTFLFSASEIVLPGSHNIENYLAAIAATQNVVDKSVYQKVAKSFSGVEHRIEFVREINKVRWFNDSIATSPSRSIAGLKAFNQKVILIAGGYDKRIPYQPLVPYILEKVSTLILTGDTGENIYQAVVASSEYSVSSLKINRAKNLEKAVELAHKISEPGDIVLLSPASASFDFYENFEARGRHFKKLVSELS